MSLGKLRPKKRIGKHILSLEWDDRSLISFSKENIEEFEWQRKTLEAIKRHYDEFRQWVLTRYYSRTSWYKHSLSENKVTTYSLSRNESDGLGLKTIKDYKNLFGFGTKNKIKTLSKVSEQVFSLLKSYSKSYSLSRMGELQTREAPNLWEPCPKAWACAFLACLGHLAKKEDIYQIDGYWLT